MCEQGQADNSKASEGAADKLLVAWGNRALLNEHGVCTCLRVRRRLGMAEVVTTRPCFYNLSLCVRVLER